MSGARANARLEAFCDGVFAIALTLLIIDIKLPAASSVTSTADLWRALQQLGPSLFAFILSFGIILITWVNHHGILKSVNDSSGPFIYANGLLLLTVVCIPFTQSLLGEFLWTDRAAPAVCVYNAVLALQAIGWIALIRAALATNLAVDERAAAAMRLGARNGSVAFAFYALLAVAALWWPVASAAVTTISWIFWLGFGLRLKHG